MPLNNSEKPREWDVFCRAQDSFRRFARKSSEVLGSPWAFISAIFIIVVVATRYVSLGSILGAIAFPIAAYFMGSTDWQTLLPACLISLMVVLKHHENIRRLLAGNENRFGGRKVPVTGEPS